MGSGRGLKPSTRGHRDTHTLAPGDELTDDATGARYRVRSLLGQGGMGRVFKADHMATGAVVAVKCNQPIDPSNTALVERARREGEFLKKLQRHPHIVPVLATGMRGDGLSWMVMPLLEGASVGGLLSVLRRIPLAWTLRIAQAVCSALAEAHRYAIHRDVKPENVFVTRDGGVFVLDFGAGKFHGIGRLTTTGTTMGTIAYSSPEQLTDPDSLDARSDLFSVGVMVFEMITGEHPFDVDGILRGNPIIIGNRIIRDPPRDLDALAPGLPRYMAAVVGKLLEKERDKRSRNAAEAERVFGAAFGQLCSAVGQPAPLERIFDAYDEALRVREAAVLAVQDTEKVPPGAHRSGPRPKFGTVPLAAFVPPSPSMVAAPRPPAPMPVLPEPVVRGGTAPIASPAFASPELPAASAPPVVEETSALPPPAVAELEQSPAAATAVAPGEADAVEESPAAAATVAPGEADAVEESPGHGAAIASVEADAVDDPQIIQQRKLAALERLLTDETPETREVLLVVLRDADEDPVIRAGAAVVLSVVGDEGCIDPLRACAADADDPVLRRTCEEAALKLSLRFARWLPPPSPATPAEEDAGADVPPTPLPEPAPSGRPPPAPHPEPAPSDRPPPLVPSAPRPLRVAAPEPRGSSMAEWRVSSLVLLAIASTLIGAAVVAAILRFVVW